MGRFPPIVVGCIAVILLQGCSPRERAPVGEEEAKVFQLFTAFREAVKEKNADRMWDALDRESQKEADKVARWAAHAYLQADSAKRADLEAELGLAGDQIPALDGKRFLTSKQFLDRYLGVVGSFIDTVFFQRERGYIAFAKADGARDKVGLRQADGEWKLTVTMPPAPK